MGVSGAGKTRFGRALASALGWDFADADDYHSAANVAKMRAGTPLTDADRAPWLASLRAEIGGRLEQGRPLVLACSALKQDYRTILLADDPLRVRFIHLDGPPELIAARLAGRAGHYMPPALLASQLATLEAPSDALRIDISLTTEAQVALARSALGL
jgi:gluconokinase